MSNLMKGHKSVGHVASSFAKPRVAPRRGMPLPDEIRRNAEELFGEDFSDVRVIVSDAAPKIGAIAFTTGSEIHIAPGVYRPGTEETRALLGHELAHVVQQRRGRATNPHGYGVAVVRDQGLEAEADRMGRALQMMQVEKKSDKGSNGQNEPNRMDWPTYFKLLQPGSKNEHPYQQVQQLQQLQQLPQEEKAKTKKRKKDSNGTLAPCNECATPYPLPGAKCTHNSVIYRGQGDHFFNDLTEIRAGFRCVAEDILKKYDGVTEAFQAQTDPDDEKLDDLRRLNMKTEPRWGRLNDENSDRWGNGKAEAFAELSWLANVNVVMSILYQDEENQQELIDNLIKRVNSSIEKAVDGCIDRGAIDHVRNGQKSKMDAKFNKQVENNILLVEQYGANLPAYIRREIIKLWKSICEKMAPDPAP